MRILIEVPTYDGSISRATSESLWRLDRGGHDVDYRPRAGYGCAMARNRIAADALNANYDYVLMVDNDISLPQDALTTLLSDGVDIALGVYLNRYARGERKRTCLFKQGPTWVMYESDEIARLRDSGEHLVHVAAGGLGCALIKTDVFERMDFPWFEWTDITRFKSSADSVDLLSDTFNSGGEDVNFCIAANKAGIAVHADTRVLCGHEFREVVWP